MTDEDQMPPVDETPVLQPDAPVPEPEAPPAEPAPPSVTVEALRELLGRVEHDVVGQCWTLFQGLRDLVATAE